MTAHWLPRFRPCLDVYLCDQYLSWLQTVHSPETAMFPRGTPSWTSLRAFAAPAALQEIGPGAFAGCAGMAQDAEGCGRRAL